MRLLLLVLLLVVPVRQLAERHAARRVLQRAVQRVPRHVVQLALQRAARPVKPPVLQRAEPRAVQLVKLLLARRKPDGAHFRVRLSSLSS